MDEEADKNIRMAIQVGASDQAKRMTDQRAQAEHVLTGPTGTFGKPKPTPATSKRPPAPHWWRGKVPD